jgi:hypothetical protein
MTFDPEAYFAIVKTWPAVVEKSRQPASPKGVFPAWPTSYDEAWDAPKCLACGALAPRDGLHVCEACQCQA